MTVHHTKPHDATLSPHGWLPLDDKTEVTALPLWDMTQHLDDGTPLFARLNYDEALAVAAREGASLPKPEHIEALRRVGVQLVPYLGTPIAENAIEHSRRHDGDVWRQLRALGWTGGKPVAGAGKHWLADAPAGKSRLMGWDKDGPGPGLAWWQPASVAHNRQHFDDGTTTILVRPRQSGGRGWTDRAFDAVADAADLLAGFLGRALASDGGGDEGSAKANVVPHGWHIAVWEVVESSRAAGTWRDASSGYEPEPGDAVIFGRAGGDPRKPGQEGHIGRLELATPAAVISIDGNVNNQVSRVTRPRREALGFIACGSAGAAALARAQSQLGVREATGHNDGAQIARYFSGATRGGKRTGFVPGWNWCAAFAGWCLLGE